MVYRVFLGNIPGGVRERDVERFFRGYGRPRDIVLKNGFGFVEFDHLRDAEDSVHDLDGRQLNGVRVRVELSRSSQRMVGIERDRGGNRGGFRRGAPPGPKTQFRIVVENLSSRTSWQDLKDFFRADGEITYTNVNVPRPGQGIVEFGSRRGMESALDRRNQLELDGKRLKIKEEKRRSRSRSRSKSRGRKSESRSRSRSRSPAPRGRRESKSKSPQNRDSRSRSKD